MNLNETRLVETGKGSYEVIRCGHLIGHLGRDTEGESRWIYDPVDEPMGHSEWKVFASFDRAAAYLGVS